MKKELSPDVEKGRIRQHKVEMDLTGCLGRFMLVHPDTGRTIFCIVSDGRDWAEEGMAGPVWEHVSVSTKFGLPTWNEMQWVKRQFWEDDEVAIQLHPKQADYVNNNEVLHLWRCPSHDLPLPPTECV